jgi:hypothetical protein
MNAHSHEAPLPRRVYFGAEDRKHLAGKVVSGGGDLHQLEIGRRQKLAATLIQRADDVANAVKTLRAMDNTGNTEHAINHLQATLQDLTKSHAIFVDDVTESIGRYRDRRENEQILAESAAASDLARMAAEEADEIGPIAEQSRANVAAGRFAVAAGSIRTAPAVGPGFDDWARREASDLAGRIAAAGATAPKPGPRA